ncbi:hypothetical protein LTR56_017358 [Elasticomyces elasticus]|nr:hypothetical protein LTR56_017358 [Elasticomyces elasticus]KAK3639041.1 hypothetical protein LTR22_017569 [Elasticomyces elasticus]KAK4915661.1 hypothetical protein LTR49_016263 [Elasticomyces elasticus]KAK5752647.1 hypothetical protein LTS12_017310 [Elasticomyces elasticus]
MFTINIVQIAVLKHIMDSVFWIAIFPALVFATMIVSFLLWTLPHHPTLTKTWREASWSRRSAWIGNCLSILLPIILCEFIYMNMVAVPKFKKKVWSAVLDLEDSLAAPSFALHYWDPSIQVDFGACTIFGDPAVNCSQNMAYGGVDNVALVMSFNASTPPVSLAQGPEAGLTITYNVSYNSSQGGYQGGVWEFIVFDSHQDVDLLQLCDPIVPLWLPAAVGTNRVYLKQTRISDDVKAVLQSDDKCNTTTYSNYTRYDTSVLTLPVMTGKGYQCDLGRSDYNGPCPAELSMSFSSLLVTTLKSSNGTDMKQMLLDEGSIVGGVMFVTWFFNIFVT